MTDQAHPETSFHLQSSGVVKLKSSRQPPAPYAFLRGEPESWQGQLWGFIFSFAASSQRSRGAPGRGTWCSVLWEDRDTEVTVSSQLLLPRRKEGLWAASESRVICISHSCWSCLACRWRWKHHQKAVPVHQLLVLVWSKMTFKHGCPGFIPSAEGKRDKRRRQRAQGPAGLREGGWSQGVGSVYSLILIFTHSFILPSTHSSPIHSFIHSVTHSPAQSLPHSLIHSFIHSLAHSLIH